MVSWLGSGSLLSGLDGTADCDPAGIDAVRCMGRAAALKVQARCIGIGNQGHENAVKQHAL